MNKVWTIILAAGASERFGSVKALAPWQNGTLLSAALEKANRVSQKNVLVVLGGHADSIRPHLGNTSSVFNEQWENGLGTSIAKGVRFVEEITTASHIVVLPIDQPLIPGEHLERLIVASSENPEKCILTSQNERSGPPIVIPKHFFSKAIQLNSEKGMKSVLTESEIHLIECPHSLRDADTPEELNQLNSTNTSDAYFAAASATQLSLIEIVLGSIVHTFKLPFGGHILSLNQGAFLCHATHRFRTDFRRYLSPLHISSVSAVLKSLSPAGQKLGPMISIAMQGYLYSLGIFVFGGSRISQSFSMMLLSLWAFVQPIVTLWLFYGKNLENAAVFYYEKLQTSMPALADVFIGVLIAVVVAKLIIAALLPWLLSRYGYRKFEDVTAQVSKKAEQYAPVRTVSTHQGHFAALIGAFKDLLKPGFLIPTLLVTAFLFFSESDNAQWIWQALRPLAIAIVFFYVSRSPWMHRFIAYLRAHNYFPGLFAVLDLTLKNLKGGI